MKRLLAMVLALTMVFTSIPSNVLAEEVAITQESVEASEDDETTVTDAEVPNQDVVVEPEEDKEDSSEIQDEVEEPEAGEDEESLEESDDEMVESIDEIETISEEENAESNFYLYVNGDESNGVLVKEASSISEVKDALNSYKSQKINSLYLYVKDGRKLDHTAFEWDYPTTVGLIEESHDVSVYSDYSQVYIEDLEDTEVIEGTITLGKNLVINDFSIRVDKIDVGANTLTLDNEAYIDAGIIQGKRSSYSKETNGFPAGNASGKVTVKGCNLSGHYIDVGEIVVDNKEINESEERIGAMCIRRSNKEQEKYGIKAASISLLGDIYIPVSDSNCTMIVDKIIAQDKNETYLYFEYEDGIEAGVKANIEIKKVEGTGKIYLCAEEYSEEDEEFEAANVPVDANLLKTEADPNYFYTYKNDVGYIYGSVTEDGFLYLTIPYTVMLSVDKGTPVQYDSYEAALAAIAANYTSGEHDYVFTATTPYTKRVTAFPGNANSITFEDASDRTEGYNDGQMGWEFYNVEFEAWKSIEVAYTGPQNDDNSITAPAIFCGANWYELKLTKIEAQIYDCQMCWLYALDSHLIIRRGTNQFKFLGGYSNRKTHIDLDYDNRYEAVPDGLATINDDYYRDICTLAIEQIQSSFSGIEFTHCGIRKDSDLAEYYSNNRVASIEVPANSDCKMSFIYSYDGEDDLDLGYAKYRGEGSSLGENMVGDFDVYYLTSDYPKYNIYGKEWYIYEDSHVFSDNYTFIGQANNAEKAKEIVAEYEANGKEIGALLIDILPDVKVEHFIFEWDKPAIIQTLSDEDYTEICLDDEGNDTITLHGNLTISGFNLVADTIYVNGRTLAIGTTEDLSHDDSEDEDVEYISSSITANVIQGGRDSYEKEEDGFPNDYASGVIDLFDGGSISSKYIDVEYININSEDYPASIWINGNEEDVDEKWECGIKAAELKVESGEIWIPAYDEKCNISVAKVIMYDSENSWMNLMYCFDTKEPAEVAANVQILDVTGDAEISIMPSYMGEWPGYNMITFPANVPALKTNADAKYFNVAHFMPHEVLDYSVDYFKGEVSKDGYLSFPVVERPEGNKITIHYGEESTISEENLYVKTGAALPDLTYKLKEGWGIEGLYYVPNDNWDYADKIYDENGKPVVSKFTYKTDIELYAAGHWAEYEVEFVPNFPEGSGGSVKENEKWGMYYTFEDPDSDEYSWAFSTAPGFIYTTAGYEIAGWTTQEGVNPIYDPENEPEVFYRADEDTFGNLTKVNNSTVKMYALWKPRTYFINYNNGGVPLKGQMEEEEYPGATEAAEAITWSFTAGVGIEELVLPVAEDFIDFSGVEFDGWYKTSACNPADKVTSISISANTYKDVELYAKWVASSYTIHFDPNYPNDEHDDNPDDPEDVKVKTLMEDQVVKFEQAVALRANRYALTTKSFIYDNEKEQDVLVSNKYVFAGWSFWPVDPNCGDIVYADTVENWDEEIEGTLVYRDKASVINIADPTERSEDGNYEVTLYAVWKNVYNVHYELESYIDTNDSTFNPVLIDSVTSEVKDFFEDQYTYGQGLKLPNCVRAGYTFNGWYSDATLKKKVTSISKTQSGDIVLYPKFTGAKYSIVYHNDSPLDGYVANATKTQKNVVFDKATALAANTFKIAGYNFVGWSIEEGSETVTFINKEVFNGIKAEEGSEGIYPRWHNKGDEKDDRDKTTAERRNEESTGNIACYSSAGFSPLHLYAVWEPIEYTITFPNGDDTKVVGAGVYECFWYGLNQIEGEENTYCYHGPLARESGNLRVPVATEIEREGYVFKGWYTDAACTKALKTISKSPYDNEPGENGERWINPGTIGNLTLYAKWACKYTIVFDGNGADNAWSDADQTKNTMVNKSAESSSAYTLPGNTYKKAGYVFMGWTTEEDGPVVYGNKAKLLNPSGIEIGEEIDDETPGVNTLTLYAVWQDTFNITVNLNGGEFEGEAIPDSYTYGTAVTLTAPVKYGYKFGGWYTDEKFKKAASIRDTTTGDVTLYAKWTGLTYNIVFNNNPIYTPEVKPVTKKQKMTYGTAKALTANAFKIKGYRFVGWSTTPYGLYANLTNKELFSGIKTIEEDGEEVVTANALYDSTTGKMRDLNLYAIWEPESYTITYNTIPEIGESWTDYYLVYFDDIILYTPGRAGYTFLGWYTDPKYKKKASNIIKAGSTGNKVYYAKWKLN